MFRHKPLYEVIVYAAKRYGLAGASVMKGFMGYGSSSIVYSMRLWEISEKLPVVIEIVDETAKIEGFIEIILPYFEKVPKGGLITVETTTVILHKTGGSN